MIIVNGYMQYEQVGGSSVGGGINPDTGLPLPYRLAFEEDLTPCQIQIIKMNNLAKSGSGEDYISLSYKVWCERVPSGGAAATTAGKVRLLDKSRQEIGVFAIVQVQELEAVRQFELYLK